MLALESIPTNIITGFLGVGKSTAILHLLKQKPDSERWAILVNEFGEVGIDGSLFAGQNAEKSGVFIREVPGGCMCCTSGLPMQIALNMLLTRAKPHRLLIEPTGLGHPREVLAALSAEHYRKVLDVHASITLVDARKVQDKRYADHSIFNQQLAIADVIIANKADQYQQEDFPALLDFLERTGSLGKKSVFQVSHGQLQLDWLLAPAGRHTHDDGHNHDEQNLSLATTQTPAPATPAAGYIGIDNEGEGFYSRGWIFNPEWTFDHSKLCVLLRSVNAERIKGVFITEHGISAFNKADNVLTESELDDSMDSRVECITNDRSALTSLEAALLNCVVTR